MGYINVCINSNNLNYAKNIIFALKKHKSRPGSLFVNKSYVYNALLEQIASNGDTKNMFSISQLMRDEEVKFDHQTYAYIFYCVGKMNIKDQEKLGMYMML